MGKSKPKVEVTQYRMSIHFGICHGIPDYISEVKIAEKSAWTGQQGTQGSFIINQPELFGGDKKEGGAVGEVHYMPGNDTQTVPERLAAKLGLTEATMPAYRGICSAWFTEPVVTNEPGFYWSANNPYLPTVWIKVARPSLLLNDHEARIWRVAVVPQDTTGAELTTTDESYTGFDTNNDWAAVYKNDGEIDVWNLLTGDQRSFVVTGAPIFGASIWITNDNEILVNSFIEDSNQLRLEFYDATSLILRQSFVIGTELYDFFNASEVTGIDGNRYIFVSIPVFSGPYPYILLKKEPADELWSLVWQVDSDETTITDWNQLSLGRDVAYLYSEDEGGDIGLVAWPAFTENLVVPTGLGSRGIRLVDYHDDTDEVIVVTDGGDVLVYSADLTTLLREENVSTSLLINPTNRGLANRIDIGGGQIALPKNNGVNHIGSILIINVDDLTVADEITIEDSAYVLSDTTLLNAAINKRHRGIFVGRALPDGAESRTAYWPLISGGEFDSNPAHVIFEALQNSEWGMGHSETSIDRASFEAAATVLFDERLGISFIWTKQSTVETLINEILDHIEAVFYCSPRTGLLTLKLIRDDYSITGLPVFTPDNCVITDFARKLWGETINEVVVSFTNPTNEETETVTAQDLANIEVQGGPISDSRNFYMVRVKEIAAMLAQRELRKSSTPLASGNIEADRGAWDLLPGDVLILNSPEDGINSIIMRVYGVDYGKPGDSRVRAQLTEDIYSLPTADYTIPPDSQWEDTKEAPSPADETLVLTLPYFFVVNLLPPDALSGLDHPEVFAGILAAEEGQDTSEFELYGPMSTTLGTEPGMLGTKSIASYAELSEDIDPATTTIFPAFTDRTQGPGPVVGGFIYIEGTTESDCEICLVTGVTSTTVTARRGVLDTIPRAWPADSPIWFVTGGQVIDDDEVRSEGETVDYKVLIRTSLGLLSPTQAPTVSYTLTDRPWLPLRPANVLVNSDDGFAGRVDCIGVDPIPVTWSRRNRETEDAIVLAWDAGDVTPEAGQTTTVTLTDLSGSVLHTYSGLAGTSQDVDPADFAGEIRGFIVVSSVRDGLGSLQSYAVEVIVSAGDVLLLEDGANLLLEDGELLLLED